MESSAPTSGQFRRASRHPLGAVAEVAVAPFGTHLVAVTSELSRNGCFIKTRTPLEPGEKVSVKITHDDKEVTVCGEVVYVLPSRGMGIAFAPIPTQEQAVVDAWLAQVTG